MPNFTIEGRAKTLNDIQRNWMWELVIPRISEVTNGIFKNEEDLVIRTRSISIPGRGNEAITSNFMGMVQHFPGKPTFPYTFEALVEETQDQIVHKALTEWQNQIFNVRPNQANTGVSLKATKRETTRDIYILEYKYNGELMEKKIRVYNCFIENVGDVSLDYTGNDSVKYSVTFRYDFWDFE